MKPFDYYSNNPVKYPTFQERDDYKTQLKKEIDDTPLTTADRFTALGQLSAKVAAHFDSQVQKANAEESRLRDEFFADARVELGYADILTEKGMRVVESWAWERGHAGGYSDIYSSLCNLSDFVSQIKGELRVAPFSRI